MSTRLVALRVARERWFLIALAMTLAIGVIWHESLRGVADAVPRNWLIAAIMLVTSSPLALVDRLSGRTALVGVALGVIVNAVLAPPIAWVASWLLPGPLAVGLIVVGIAPCTLASAPVWTRRGGGDAAVALAVTVVTNFGCFLVLPFWVWALMDPAQGADAPDLVSRLLVVVVAPMLFGQLLRRHPPTRHFIDRRRRQMGYLALCGVLVMVFIGSVRAGELLADPTTGVGWLDGLWLVLVVALVHTVLFAIGWRIGRAATPPDKALAVAVSGSQKTLTVGLDVALGFGGLAVLPMLAYHALQLVIDEVLVEKLGPGEK